MCSTFSREILTFVVGSFPFRNSRISICVLEDRSASLNFWVESFYAVPMAFWYSLGVTTGRKSMCL